jgi:hypothetical protein
LSVFAQDAAKDPAGSFHFSASSINASIGTLSARDPVERRDAALLSPHLDLVPCIDE